MSRCTECYFVRDPGDNLERSPALPLLLPCPLHPPHFPVNVSSCAGRGEEQVAQEQAESVGLTSSTGQQGHCCFLPPCSYIPCSYCLRHTLDVINLSLKVLHHLAPTYLHAFPPPPTICFANLPVLLHLFSHPSCISTSLPYAHL